MYENPNYLADQTRGDQMQDSRKLEGKSHTLLQIDIEISGLDPET